MAGIRHDAAGLALTVATGLGGPPEARLFGGERIGAVAAAFGNAVAVHALDFDDTHPGGLVHASAVTVPVALAVGEQIGATGEEMLTALVAGLETVCRLGAAAPHGFHARGLHATSICGPIAAAVTAGRLLGLDPPTMTAAIGIAAGGASGLLEFPHSPASTKQLPGTAVANGILAARLAAAGATGPAGALDGAYGLYRALANRPPDRAVLFGEGWETTRIAIKPYPCCQLSHASLDAARVLRKGADVARERWSARSTTPRRPPGPNIRGAAGPARKCSEPVRFTRGRRESWSTCPSSPAPGWRSMRSPRPGRSRCSIPAGNDTKRSPTSRPCAPATRCSAPASARSTRSAQLALHEGDLVAQAEYIYANIETVLAAGGVSGSAVTSLIEYVTPVAVADYPRTRALREKHFPNAAVTAAVCSALLRPEFLLETIPGVVPA